MKQRHIYKSISVDIHTGELESKRCQELYQKPPHVWLLTLDLESCETPKSKFSCPSPGITCTSFPHQLHQGTKLHLVQKSVSFKMPNFPSSHLGANQGLSSTGLPLPGEDVLQVQSSFTHYTSGQGDPELNQASRVTLKVSALLCTSHGLHNRSSNKERFLAIYYKRRNTCL